jgi:hypothetical protein
VAAHMLIDVLEDEHRRVRMSAAALERVRDSFTRERVAPRLVDFLCDSASPTRVEVG